MLKRLTVSNLAVVERAEALFSPGLTVVTGETGAGKSVFLGALELALGGRAEADIVREGAKEAEVEADFGDVVIRRTVTAQGRSRAWVNDESVSVAELREVGRGLVDVHGPRANQALLDEPYQRAALDAFGVAEETLRAYAERWSAYAAARGELESLAAAASEEEVDFLRFQVNELESAALCDDDETVAERHAAAAHAEELVEEANAVTEALGGELSAAGLLVDVRARLGRMARHLPAAAAWGETAERLTLEVEELSRTVADAVSGLEVGGEDLAELDARLTLLNRLKRKHRVDSVAGLQALLRERRARLDGFENREETLSRLRATLAAREGDLRAAGGRLTAERRAAAKRLGRAVTEQLHDLGFQRAGFAVALEPQDPAPGGMDRVVFRFEPNPGEAERPLADIASMGEIARVMLALKTVLAERSGASARQTTLVFDEIDANIGGEVGRVVGEKLRAVARRHQVVAITHLPQSAVYGERHLVVTKTVRDGRTRTAIGAVEGAARVTEIARMLGGEKLTSVVRKHAQELLEIPG